MVQGEGLRWNQIGLWQGRTRFAVAGLPWRTRCRRPFAVAGKDEEFSRSIVRSKAGKRIYPFEGALIREMAGDPMVVWQ